MSRDAALLYIGQIRRIRKSVRVTSTMEAAISEYVWDIAELLK